VVARMVPRSLREAKGGKVSWPTEGAAWTEARRELFEVVRR